MCQVCEDALKDCRSVILASGTLCPSETFKTELGIEFKLHMEGDQIIPKDRIFATVIAKGPGGNSLRAVYRNLAPQSPLLCELAQILLDVCRTVPKGVLCFVSSYKILENLMQTLRASNYMQRIEQKKVVIGEPRRSSDLASTMEKFDDAIESPQKYGVNCDGALMIAVYRGKLSEGIDFTDDKARCVVCVGIPFPNTKDDLVMEKRKFNDENRAIHGLISGERWYSTQAYRALNQALGRCLRHKNDWGAILLVDERFVDNARSKEPQSESQKIPKWVCKNLRIHRGYHEFKADLDRFVQMRLSIDANTADVKAVKPNKPMPILDEEERSPSSFSDEVIVLDDEPAAAQKCKVELNEEFIVLEDDDEVIVLDDSD
ncbi:Protein DOG-1 [Aphelenchoides avenae]|nr:Protein DOG-1 [Aphelenchus avenae]